MQCRSVPDGTLCDLETGIVTIQCDGVRCISLYLNGIRAGVLRRLHDCHRSVEIHQVICRHLRDHKSGRILTDPAISDHDLFVHNSTLAFP